MGWIAISFCIIHLTLVTACVKEFQQALSESQLSQNLNEFLWQSELNSKPLYDSVNVYLSKISQKSSTISEAREPLCKTYERFQDCLTDSIPSVVWNIVGALFQNIALLCDSNRFNGNCVEMTVKSVAKCWKNCGDNRDNLRLFSVNDFKKADWSFFTLNGKTILTEACRNIPISKAIASLSITTEPSSELV